jgi:hypothetical protein
MDRADIDALDRANEEVRREEYVRDHWDLGFVEEKKMTKFTLDGVHVYEGEYVVGPEERWNGFACPMFDKFTAVEILEDCGATEIRFTPKRRDYPNGLLSWKDREGEYDHCPMGADGMFALGAYAWIWDEADESL